MTVHRPHRHKPKFLLVVDHDNERFTIEGPVYDHLPWIVEISHACRGGRQIDYRVVMSSKVTDIMANISLWAKDIDYELWPPKSIVVPSDSSNC
jgi:hypothetical protein